MKTSIYDTNALQAKWTKDEEKFLVDNYLEISIEELVTNLSKSTNTIYIKACQLGLKKSNKWTKKEIELLKKYYENSNTEILIALSPNHTLGSINKKAKQFKLKRKNIEKPCWTIE